jgi:hypothetical protein
MPFANQRGYPRASSTLGESVVIGVFDTPGKICREAFLIAASWTHLRLLERYLPHRRVGACARFARNEIADRLAAVKIG